MCSSFSSQLSEGSEYAPLGLHLPCHPTDPKLISTIVLDPVTLRSASSALSGLCAAPGLRSSFPRKNMKNGNSGMGGQERRCSEQKRKGASGMEGTACCLTRNFVHTREGQQRLRRRGSVGPLRPTGQHSLGFPVHASWALAAP